MPGDLELALRVRADMREALSGMGALNRSLGDTTRQGGEAGRALESAAGAAQALGALGQQTGAALGRAQAAAESVFHGIEGALLQFVNTGKLSFSGFVDSVIADLARLAVQRAVTEPLAAAFFGALGGGGGAPSSAHANAPLLLHAGGPVGAPGGVRRHGVPPAVFAGAARYHGGGIAGLRPDEVPIIAQAGETVLPRGAQDRAAAGRYPLRQPGHAAARSEPPRRARPAGLVVSIVTDDLDRGGPIAQTLRRNMGGASHECGEGTGPQARTAR